MRPIKVAAASPTASEPSQRSLVAAAPSAASTTCLLLLAFSGSLEPIGSLRLQRAAQDLPFAMQASTLRLPDTSEREAVANELLWYATRHDRVLRTGGALLAHAAESADREELVSLGFAAVAEEEQQEADEPPLLALVNRRDPSEPPADSSHAALFVSDIRTSVEFWSLLRFGPTRLFTTEGARAAWLSAPWTSLSLELIEVPDVVLRTSSCGSSPAAAAAAIEDEEASPGLGLAHVCVDVTPLGISLTDTLALLQQRSAQSFGGRTLLVMNEPHQQMMAELVCDVAVVRAPDGVVLELVHRLGTLGTVMESDWSLDDEEKPYNWRTAE